MKLLPHNIFHASPEERMVLARRQYFEEGLRPSGIVNDSVLQSWARCQRYRHDPKEQVEFQLVSSSRAHLALQRNHLVLQAWSKELAQLEGMLAATSCAAILTDATGVLIATTGTCHSHERLMPIAHRIGVNLSEEIVGTTAPGLVIKTGKPASVLGGEHYFEGVKSMHCAGAPIYNTKGQLAAVLDISSENMPFEFDTAAIVGVYAASIENRLLISEAREHLILKIQVCSTLIDTPMVGLAGINAQGQLAWSNSVATRLLGLDSTSLRRGRPAVAEEIFGVDLSRLLSLPQDGATPLRLSNGLTVWARSKIQAPDGQRGLFSSHVPSAPLVAEASATLDSRAHATSQGLLPVDVKFTNTPIDGDFYAEAHPPSQEPTSLRESDQELILRTLETCGGNVSKAAKQLGVSRGLIYRRLKDRNLRE